MPAAIETHNLTRRFGTRTGVDALSMTVPERAVYGFLGRNGAGKTTTIKLLLGLLKADSGSVRIVGADVAADRQAVARNVGALLEAQGFYPHLTGYENLDLTRRMIGQRRTEISRVLDITEMGAHACKRVADFSLGMRQRLGIARAMLGAPPLLILDEPTNGLDPDGIADMRTFLRDLPTRTGATVLVSSHLLAEIEQVATHVGILSQGKLVLEGSLTELKAGLASEVTIEADRPERAIAIAREHGFELVREDDGLVARFTHGGDVQDATAALNKVLCMAGVGVHRLTPRKHSLETLYRQVSGFITPTATL